MDPKIHQPKIALSDEQIYSLLLAKKAAGVLNSNFDFVHLETNSGEVLPYRIVENAQHLVLYHHENLTVDDIKVIKLCSIN